MRNKANSLTRSETEELVRAQVDEILRGPALSQVVAQVVVQTSSYSGPLPPADETAKYERVHPGFTDRWITMAEREQQNVFTTTKRRDIGQIAYKVGSLLAAFLICICLVVGGIFLLYQNKTVEGFGSIGVAASAVFAAILIPKKKKPAA